MLQLLLSIKIKTCLMCGHFTLRREESPPDRDRCCPGDITWVIEVVEMGSLWCPGPSPSSFLTDPFLLELKVLWPAVQTPWGSEEFPPCQKDPGETAEVWGKSGPEDPAACSLEGAAGHESLGAVLSGHRSGYRGTDHLLSPHSASGTLVHSSLNIQALFTFLKF